MQCSARTHIGARTPPRTRARMPSATNTQGTCVQGPRTDDGGTVVGSALGARLGAAVGLTLGDPDGCSVGESDGCSELYSAAPDGTSDGVSDGNPDGPKLGVTVGSALGACTCIDRTAWEVVRPTYLTRAVGARAQLLRRSLNNAPAFAVSPTRPHNPLPSTPQLHARSRKPAAARTLPDARPRACRRGDKRTCSGMSGDAHP